MAALPSARVSLVGILGSTTVRVIRAVLPLEVLTVTVHLPVLTGVTTPSALTVTRLLLGLKVTALSAVAGSTTAVSGKSVPR